MDLKVLPGLRYNRCGSGPTARLQIGGGWEWAWVGTSNATDNMNSVLTPCMRELSPSLLPLCECLSETLFTEGQTTGIRALEQMQQGREPVSTNRTSLIGLSCSIAHEAF